MNNKIANILTIVFQPLLVPMYGLTLLLAVPQFYGYNMWAKIGIIAACVAIMVVLPVIWYLVLVKLKVITTPQASDRKERLWAYLFTLICYFCTAWFLYNIDAFVIAKVVLMAFWALLAVTIINFFWKISAHATGISGLLGASVYISFAYGVYNPPLLVTLIFCCGFVCSARLQLKAHTPMQLIAGTLLGFTFMFVLPILI
ncbi:MAG: hypothetical protein MJ003_05995 [Paludibacteraceae bacterium]|nr:hypothetical protein [Paludibacteraceae bacterium]